MIAIVLYALFAVSFNGAQQQREELTPIVNSDRLVVAAHARLFGVRDADEAWRMWNHAWKQQLALNSQVATWNKPAVYAEWSKEVDQRMEAWWLLGQALTRPYLNTYPVTDCDDDGTLRVRYVTQAWTNWDRVEALYRLRDLIGREAFYAGVMPRPTPNYKLLPNEVTR